MEFSTMAGAATLEILDAPEIKWLVQDPLLTGTGTYAKSSHQPAEETGIFQLVDEYMLPYLPSPREPDVFFAAETGNKTGSAPK